MAVLYGVGEEKFVPTGVFMSEHALLILGTIFGAVGAVADVTIVGLMIWDRPRTVGGQRRYAPWIFALMLTTIASVLPAYFIYRLTTGTERGQVMLAAQSAAATSVVSPPPSGTAEVEGGATTWIVRADVEEPYDVFCQTSWGSECFSSERRTGSFVLTFGNPTPHDGGRVEWRMKPIPPIKAYQQQKAIVADRDRTINGLKDEVSKLQGQMSQQSSQDQNLKSQLQAWSAYHEKVIGVVNDIERTDCAQQAIQANAELIAAQNEKAGQDANIERLKKERPGGPGPAGWMFLQRAKEQLDKAQSDLRAIQKGINNKLETVRGAPQV